MKPTLFLILAFPCLLGAQEVSKDPFVKDKKAATSDPTVADTSKNVSCLIETITLPQSDYAAIIDSPKGREALHDRVLDAVKAGSAVLDGCHFLITSRGTRSRSQSTDELLYPSEWDSPNFGGYQFPSAFEMQPLGDKLEFEPVMDDKGGALSINQDFTRDRFTGFRASKADTSDSGVPVPGFVQKGSPTGCDAIPGVPALVSTWASSDSASVTLVFATPQVEPSHQPPEPAEVGVGNMHVTARVYSVERANGWELLRKHSRDASACYADVKSWVSARDAVLEHISTSVTRPGTRAQNRSGRRYYYGTEFIPPLREGDEKADRKNPGKPVAHASPAGVTSFDCRDLGFSWEMEGTLNSEGTTFSITVSFGCASLVGQLKDPLWSERYPEMPLFSEQRITTSFTQANGSVILVGTLNPPGDTGANERKDAGRMWLLFFETNLE